MRLLPNIRFGTERYPEKVARRLRTLNIGTWIGSAIHAYTALFYFIDSSLALVYLSHVVWALLYACVPLLHRFGSLAGPAAAIIFLYVDVFVMTYLFGTHYGVQAWYLVAVALTVLYFGTEYIALSWVSAAVAAALISFQLITVPYDTGLLPASLFYLTIISIAALGCGTLLLIASYALGEVARAEVVAEREYERSERLLTNMLPSAIAARLKSESNIVIADRHDEASILFADMAGFTAQASDTAPDDLVQFLNRVFSDFDRLVERHGLEKIKTTGDAYMVVSGVPTARPDHAQALALLALEMREAAAGWRDAHGRNVPIRMGMSSGPVVAGVVGTRKFFYDVWGDAVNVASRMETTGTEGKIQVSQDIYERLRDEFDLEPRGEIDVKGKGMMPTWFLLARKQLAGVRPSPEDGGVKLRARPA
jgi:adenylate cyclase